MCISYDKLLAKRAERLARKNRGLAREIEGMRDAVSDAKYYYSSMKRLEEDVALLEKAYYQVVEECDLLKVKIEELSPLKKIVQIIKPKPMYLGWGK